MSNILIIKHGSLGDIAQACGAIQDIFENHKEDKVYLLTTKPYFELFKQNPFIHDVILDKRLSRFNLIYLYSLMRKIKKLNIIKVYDLQNSSRSYFYKIIFKIKDWSSTKTILNKNQKKKEFDSGPVLDRFEQQLMLSGVKVNYTTKPDLNWACEDVTDILNRHFTEKFILIFPFCSERLPHKKWIYFNELIEIINSKKSYKIVIAPGPEEIDSSKQINAITITDNQKSLNLMQLAGLIKKSSFVISNDTGPAHMAAHLGKEGIVLFGHHTTPQKVSIETDKFKAITVSNLIDLPAEKVYLDIKNKLGLINH